MKSILFLLASAAFSSAQAGIVASPSFQDLGGVVQGTTETAVIYIHNTNGRQIMNLNVSCYGDIDVFRCSTSCFGLAPYGRCTVYVDFTPRTGDRLRRSVDVRAIGSMGAFATSTVVGTDLPRP